MSKCWSRWKSLVGYGRHLSYSICHKENPPLMEKTFQTPKNITKRTHDIFLTVKKKKLYQNTLYFIRSHFISSKHILFTRPETILFHQNTLYFIKTHLFTGRHFISSEHTLFLSEHSLFHQNTFYSPYHVLITKCMLSKCTSHHTSYLSRAPGAAPV